MKAKVQLHEVLYSNILTDSFPVFFNSNTAFTTVSREMSLNILYLLVQISNPLVV